MSVSVNEHPFSTQQIASRYALTVAARIELRDLRENKVLWENPSLIFRQEYEPQTGRIGNPQESRGRGPQGMCGYLIIDV